jgi:hypothetical protein
MVAIVVAGSNLARRSRVAGIRPFSHILGHGLVGVVLILLGGWAVYANWPLRAIRFNELDYSEPAAQRLIDYPEAQYAFGMQAWTDQQAEKAADFYRQAVSQNVLFIDAWLRLAEVEAAMGQESKAGAILAFVDGMTGQVQRWKWSQMVLASQLGMNAKFYGYANDLLARGTLTQDTLQLLHTHFGGEASAILNVLAPQNQAVYLDWLMRWGMAEESLAVWPALTAATPPDKNLALRYAHFLLSHKRINQSVEIWRQYTGSSALTNPGFENKITGRAFDWRLSVEKEGNWELKRVFSESAEGNYALRLKFNGKANISFHHLYQIIAVTPNTDYRLSYTWKAIGITTDQGPFLEIIGYDKRGLHEIGTMMTGTHGWHDDFIDFSVPDNCHAVVVRLRRKTSMRFDSKIRGTIWLDNFKLEEAGIEPLDGTAVEDVRFSPIERQAASY